MKKLFYNIGLSMAVMVGCTDKFAEINTIPTQPAPGSLTDTQIIDGHMRNAFPRGLMNPHVFQRVQSLYTLLYAQYFANSSGFSSGRYAINQGWLGDSWSSFYPSVMGSLVIVISYDGGRDEEKAIARIWKAFLFQRYVTLYGDIPYSNLFDATLPEKYDPQSEIYDDLFKELKASADILSAASAEDALQEADDIYGGDIEKWAKFANSLRLRLALRISKKDPARAKIEAEAAIAAGVFESNDDNAYFSVGTGWGEWNAFISVQAFGSNKMSASMESVLVGYNDPRLEILFSPADSLSDKSGVRRYSGIRNGLATKKIKPYTGRYNSDIGPKFAGDFRTQTPRIILTYAEQCFLMAEAKLNEWMVSGTAEEWYKNGIKASMNQFSDPRFAEKAINDASMDDYIEGTSTPIIPFAVEIPASLGPDPEDENAGITRGISTLPVKWASTSPEQLEQIGIQKWLALWPDSFEAWAEFRRTGFPKLYPVPSIENSDVSEGNFIQRIPYLDSKKILFPDAISTAANRMGGDLQATKLYFAGGN